MTSRDFEPSRLDVAAFAKSGGVLGGRWPLSSFLRLTEPRPIALQLPCAREVVWQARGELRAESQSARSGEAQVWLHVRASTTAVLECQRCLGPVEVLLVIERNFRFVYGEDAAAQLDAESEDDVLALTRALDLRDLIEDELLLALPIVPRHEVCPVPLASPVADDAVGKTPNPFALLMTLKRAKRPN